MKAQVQASRGRDLKRRAWQILDVARPGDAVSRAFDFFILTLVLLNVIAVILETVEPLGARYAAAFRRFEVFSVAVFTVEYLARLWSCVSRPEYARPVAGRLRFALRPMSLVDLLAVLPFYLEFVWVDLRFVRVLRLLRIFRVAKLGRYSSSVGLLGRVVRKNKEELVVTFALMALLVVLASSCMYFAEHEAQPDKFPDIPSAMWWSIVTLTTVGYGDVYPLTPLGKFFAGVISILGIGMFALPTGILGASFVEELQREKAGGALCPHCGQRLDAPPAGAEASGTSHPA
jgi:voltage-gated potassium channel